MIGRVSGADAVHLESRICWQQWSFVRRKVEKWCVVENLFALPLKNVRRLQAKEEEKVTLGFHIFFWRGLAGPYERYKISRGNLKSEVQIMKRGTNLFNSFP